MRHHPQDPTNLPTVLVQYSYLLSCRQPQHQSFTQGLLLPFERSASTCKRGLSWSPRQCRPRTSLFSDTQTIRESETVYA